MPQPASGDAEGGEAEGAFTGPHHFFAIQQKLATKTFIPHHALSPTHPTLLHTCSRAQAAVPLMLASGLRTAAITSAPAPASTSALAMEALYEDIEPVKVWKCGWGGLKDVWTLQEAASWSINLASRTSHRVSSNPSACYEPGQHPLSHPCTCRLS